MEQYYPGGDLTQETNPFYWESFSIYWFHIEQLNGFSSQCNKVFNEGITFQVSRGQSFILTFSKKYYWQSLDIADIMILKLSKP